MFDISLTSWLLAITGIVLASASGVAVASRFPWAHEARHSLIPLAAGLSFGPFLAGMGAVLMLLLLPGRPSALHLAGIALMLLALCALYRPSALPQRRTRLSWVPSVQKISFLEVVLFLWLAALAVLPNLVPLTQNDALEYATVGRIVFDARDLMAYPAIHPETTASGFFGPWTHPPLFVALFYAVYALQGTDIAPGLGRLISPWFAIACTWLLYTLAARLSKASGLFAALVFVSCPLFFLGADSSLIDALPIAGLLLSFAVLVYGDPNRKLLTGAIAGLPLGFALWTHSQAILFIPMLMSLILARHGLRHLPRGIAQGLAMLAVALLLSAYPYLRNYQIFGALVSDMPAIFALPSLRWDDYFSIARGIAHWPAKIQYGLLKGWFTPESYAASFWLATLGLGIFLWQALRSARSLILDGVRDADGPLNLLYSTFLVIFAYLSAVTLSVLMGIDLAIRNERYWLILLPFIALFAGWGLAVILRRLEKLKSPLWAQGYVTAAGLVLLAQLGVLGLYRVSPYLPLMQSQSSLPAAQWSVSCASLPAADVPPGASDFCPASTVSAPDWQRTSPMLLSMRYLAALTPEDSLVFSMFPANMYYSQRKMLSYLDPRLLPFYAARSAQEGAEILRGLSVDYIHLPNYYLPPVYHSTLQEILARPDLSSLVFSGVGEQIYRLAPEPRPRLTQTRDLTPGAVTWTRAPVVVLGGRKALGRSTDRGDGATAFDGPTSTLDLPYGLFQRNRGITLTSGAPRAQRPEDALIPIAAGDMIGLRVRFSGHGYMQFRVEQYDASQSYIGNIPLGDISITHDPEVWSFERRFMPSQDARYLRVSIEHTGQSELTLRAVELSSSAEQAPEPSR